MIFALLLASSLGAAPPDPRVTLLDAMAQEGARSMDRLRLAGYDAPYFLSYGMREGRFEEVAGRSGAVTEEASRRDRKLLVDVRVGSYELDSSGRDDLTAFFGPEGQTWFAPREGPLDDAPMALRNALWILTDERYKEALSSWFKRRSRGVYRAELADRGPSFSREPAERHVDPPSPFPFDRARWRGEVRRLSALVRDHPAIFDATVKVNGEKVVRWFTSSEGSAVLTESSLYGVHLHAIARASDGQLLENSRDFYGRSEGGLPSPVRLDRELRDLLAELELLRAAPALDPYTGPAILAPEAVGVLFHEALGHRLEGERQEDDKEGQTFKGALGRPILPAFLTVVDDPTLAEAGGMSLNGAYAFDDQGVSAQRALLVERGVLRGFLLSRRPVKPFLRSNGHGRSQGFSPPVARMANLVVSSSRSVPMAELKRMLLAEARRQGKPYGLIIRDITGGSTNTGAFGFQAFKGTPRLAYRVDVTTGREELVRGVELVGTPLTSVAKVVATGDEVRAFNGFCGAESGYVPVSTVAPAALISELELQRVSSANERSPILPPPWSEAPP